MRRADVDHDTVLEHGVAATQRRAGDGRLHAHRTDAAGDVGEVLLALAAQVELGEMAMRALGDAQLHVAVGGAEHPVVGAAQTVPLPERVEFARVRHAELDVEQPVERHHAPAFA